MTSRKPNDHWDTDSYTFAGALEEYLREREAHRDSSTLVFSTVFGGRIAVNPNPETGEGFQLTLF